jgi:hypothetical protein
MKVVLSSTVALAMVAGCQAQIATKGEVETTVGKGSTTVAAGTTAQPAKKTENPQAADPNTAVDNANDGALDRSKPMTFKASEGGVYVSDDGLLKAVFPPGSLSQDTTVKMVRVDTGKLKNSDVFLNGIRYQLDLGDAYITPGSRVTVTSKADDRLVGALKGMYTDYTPERYSLSKDDKGNWNVTMSLRGATENDPPAPVSGAGPTRGIMEEGGFPITPAKAGGGFKQDSRIEAFCNYYPPPKPASYGDFTAHVSWTSDSESGLKGKDAHENNDASGGDNRVTVNFSTNYSAAPLPKKYTITDTIPGTPARPEIDVDQYGNVVSPAYGTIAADYKPVVDQALVQWAKNGAFIDFTGAKVNFSGSTWTQPGKPKTGDAEFGKPENKVALLGAVAATSPEEIVDATNVAIGDANGRYVIGGHPYNGNCNCGAYVIVQDTSVIEGSGKKLTDSAGIARIRALQSYDSTQCSAGICAGGQVNFTIFAQASIRYPQQAAENSVGYVDGFGAPGSQDSAAGRPLELEVPKYSPYITMNMKDPQGKLYNAKLIMEYSLDGQDYTMGDMDPRWDFGATQADLQKKFFMPNVRKDDPVKLSIRKLYSKDLTMIASPATLKNYQNYAIQRNNKYQVDLDMIPNEAK